MPVRLVEPVKSLAGALARASRQGEHQLAGVVASEQLAQHTGEGAHATAADVLAGDEPAVAQPARQLFPGLGITAPIATGGT